MTTEKSEVVRLIELASAKACIKNICETSFSHRLNKSRHLSQKIKHLEANRPSNALISDLVEYDCGNKADEWWQSDYMYGDVHEGGAAMWTSAIKKKPYLYLNYYLVGLSVAFVLNSILGFFNPVNAITYSLVLGIVVGFIYKRAQEIELIELFALIRGIYLIEQLDWRLESLCERYQSIHWQNLEQLHDHAILERAGGMTEEADEYISPDYFIKKQTS